MALSGKEKSQGDFQFIKKRQGQKHNKASLRMPRCDETKCQLPLWIREVVVYGGWRGGGAGKTVCRIIKCRLHG